MTKSELVTYVSTATGIPCDTAWEAVTATVDAIIDAVGNEGPGIDFDDPEAWDE